MWGSLPSRTEVLPSAGKLINGVEIGIKNTSQSIFSLKQNFQFSLLGWIWLNCASVNEKSNLVILSYFTTWSFENNMEY